MLTDDLLELQRIDTVSDQLRHRRSGLAERSAAASAHGELTALERRTAALDARAVELDEAITAAERDGQVLSAQRARLEGQLRTVIAPREAEALMHEIESIGRRRDELDDRELEHLEEQANVNTERTQLAQDEPDARSRAGDADAALLTAEGEIDAEVERLAASRADVLARVDTGWLRRYDQLRQRFGGVAIARLVGTRCDGCHLDLSTAELDDIRHGPTDAPAECPQCGRLLVTR